MNDKFKKILIISIIFCFIVIGFVLYKTGVIRTDEEILLKAAPVNVMDLLNEENIDLQYNISNIRIQDVIIEDPNFKIGNEVYVCVEVKQDGYAIATGIYSNPPKNQLFIKGTLKGVANNILDIDYGTGKYFIPKNTDFSGDMDAKIVIDKSGNAEIKSLFIGGKEIK